MEQLSDPEILFIVLVASAAMTLLVLAIGIFLFVYQKRLWKYQIMQLEQARAYEQEMITAQLESQELDRKRIAADLHDSIGSLLWAAKLNASFLERSFVYQPEQQQSYVELMDSLDQSLDSIKRIAWELTPQAFQQAGLSESVLRLCARLNKTSLSVSCAENRFQLWNDDRALSTFRILQELLSNSVKHASASLISIQLDWGSDYVSIIVRDNGIGFSLDKTRTGVGWWNINQRAKQLGALISIGQPPIGTGSEIKFRVPLFK